VRAILELLVAAALLPLDGGIAAMTAVARDVVVRVDALSPLLHDGAELSDQVAMAGYACVVLV
jgi:hypothetical protein